MNRLPNIVLSLPLLALLGTTATVTAQPVLASDNEALMTLLRILHERGSLTDEEFELVQRVAGSEERLDVDEGSDQSGRSPETDRVDLSRGRLQFKSADGAHSARIGGRIHADYGLVDDRRDLDGSGSQFRRARVEFAGVLDRDWQYRSQVDFAGNQTTLQDLYLQYDGLDPVSIRLGRHIMPSGMDLLASSNNIVFMERSLINDVFGIGRENGLSFYSSGTSWSFQGSVWLDGVSAENDLKNEDYGAGVRVSRGYVLKPDHALHLGLSYNQRRFSPVGAGNDKGYASQRFRARPEIRLVSNRPFDVTLAEVTSTEALGIEGAWVRGPFSLQSEYFTQRVGSESGNSDFSGWYLAGSYMLTGESRPYRASTGTFGAVRPSHRFSSHGGSGAWELSLRYSALDLYDKGAPVVSTSPGQTGEVWTLGLNWYPTASIRFMGNYVDARVGYPGEDRSDDRIRALQVRGQVAF